MRLDFNITSSGRRVTEIKGKHNYVNINNNSQFDFFLYNWDDHSLIGIIPPFSVLSFPLDKSIVKIETVWQSASIRWTAEQKCSIIFSEERT